MAIIYFKQKLRVFDSDATKKKKKKKESLFMDYGQWQFVPFWGSQRRKQILTSSCFASVVGVLLSGAHCPLV